MKLTFILPGLLVVCSTALAADLELTLPPRVYAVAGAPMSVYYDNIVLTEKPEAYRFEFACDVGKQEERRWTVTPTDAQVGDHAMSVTVKDGAGKVLGRAKTTLHVSPRNAGEGKTVRLLIVGDSLTHATLYPNEIARLLSEPGNPKWTMLGTHKPANAAAGVAHEGYGGWTWAAFLSKYDANPAKTAEGKLPRKMTSPFVYAGADGKPALDIARYIREECGGQPPDVVFFLLGVNDCFSFKPDDRAALDKSIDGVLENATKLLTAFKAAAPKATLAVGLTTPPNVRDEAFVANYNGKYHRWPWKRIQHRLVQRMLQQSQSGKLPRLPGVLVPTELNVDPIDGYPDNNAVHPNAVGYAQIGASVYAWLKAWLAGGG